LKGDKVLVFKKKRRKGYQKLNGFRPSLTELVIQGISLGGKAPKAKAKPKAKPKAKKAEAPADAAEEASKNEE
jgi:large subunit ribosomal protein L21